MPTHKCTVVVEAHFVTRARSTYIEEAATGLGRQGLAQVLLTARGSRRRVAARPTAFRRVRSGMGADNEEGWGTIHGLWYWFINGGDQ